MKLRVEQLIYEDGTNRLLARNDFPFELNESLKAPDAEPPKPYHPDNYRDITE